MGLDGEAGKYFAVRHYVVQLDDQCSAKHPDDRETLLTYGTICGFRPVPKVWGKTMELV